MFRLSCLSLFLVGAAVALVPGTKELERQLKEAGRQLQDIDLDQFQFNFAGININAETAQEACPNEWSATVSCVITKCPNFLDVCPDIDVPSEFQGTAPPGAAPGDAAEDAVAGEVAEEVAEEAADDMGGNMTDSNATDAVPAQLPAEVDEPAEGAITANPDAVAQAEAMAAAGEVPSCEELSEAFCDTFAGEDLTECCLLDCTAEVQDLLVCVVKDTTGEDRSNCEVPVCPTGAPAESDAGGDTSTGGTTPAPETASSAAGLISRIAVLGASVAAFVML